MQRFLGSRSELVIVIAMIGILLVLFTPIPAGLLDVLLVMNFSFAMLILLLTFYMEKPIGFSTFPAILLIATLFRLSLNIAATRLILSDADAGAVIGAVGHYVVGGSYIIGLVVFCILIVVQYVVVTNGAQRVAEVAARFTLDSMPGKQMSIDADLNMGIIDQETAQARRKDIEKEANFYGSMDGASKFVKGDAIAGIIIILIDIIGGLTVGLAQLGMSWGEALKTFTLLTVGDGIVTQIPALVISTATGIIVTRASADSVFGRELTRQIARHPQSLIVVAIGLALLLLLPGIPFFPVAVVLAAIALAAWFALRAPTEDDEKPEGGQSAQPGPDDEGDLYSQMRIEPIEVFLGEALVEGVGSTDSLFMQKVKVFRKRFALDMGVVLPQVKIKDNARLPANGYEIRIHGVRVASGTLYPERRLVIGNEQALQRFPGELVEDPTYGLPAKWVEADQLKDDAVKEYTAVDGFTVISTHFAEVMKRHAGELIGRTETESILANAAETSKGLLDDIVPGLLSMADIHAVLRSLVAERVPIRNTAAILEALADKARASKEPADLVEACRQRLARFICEPLLDDKGTLGVITFDSRTEQSLVSALQQTESGVVLLLEPSVSESLVVRLAELAEKQVAQGNKATLLCTPRLRRPLRRLTERTIPLLSILSLSEVPADVTINSVAAAALDVRALSALQQGQIRRPQRAEGEVV